MIRLPRVLLVAVLAPGLAFAQATANRDGPLSEPEFQVFAAGGEQLKSCVGAYMGSHPLDESVGASLIKLGLGGELKVRAMAAISPASGNFVALRSLDPNKPAEVSNMLALLAQELSTSDGAIDRRPYVLGLAVFNYYLARLAGESCKVEPELAMALPRARYDRLTPMPELGFDGLKLQREVDQAALCAFGTFPAEVRGSDAINDYIANHGDLARLRADAEAFAVSSGDPQADAAARAYLDSLVADSTPAQQAGHFMGLLLGSERSEHYPPVYRYRAAALGAYHLSRASGGTCKLGATAMQLIGKDK